MTKRQKTWLLIAGCTALAGGIIGVWALAAHPSANPVTLLRPTPVPTPQPSPTPVRVASPLTGLMVDPAVAAQPVVGVIIENLNPDARPQSGLSDAGVVYEANAEGGITRFLALYLDKIPASLGPVRSLRTYFLDWALEYGAPVAHAGGNQDALDLIKPLGLKDMNALSFAADGFLRTTDRVAPHNLYTSDTKLKALLARLGYAGPASFTPAPRQTSPATASTAVAHPHIHLDFSYAGYQVDYDYDTATSDYARSMGGTPHIDRTTGRQIHVKNIVVEMMPTSYGLTRIGEQTVIMQTVGQGSGWVMHDGNATPITWKKSSHAARTQLLGADDHEVPLDPGNTWFAIVPVGKTVSY
ncbi:MAG TPA: DUF3048 domain-containing protein [Candidatus Saccharimonadia bacterium]